MFKCVKERIILTFWNILAQMDMIQVNSGGDGETILQQDNATCHDVNSVKSWAAEQNLQILPWPGNSPDLNPIEHIWDYIVREK